MLSMERTTFSAYFLQLIQVVLTYKSNIFGNFALYEA